MSLMLMFYDGTEMSIIGLHSAKTSSIMDNSQMTDVTLCYLYHADN